MNRIVKHYESLHDGDLKEIGLQPKMDPVGIWTEGWGHAIVYNGKFLKGISNKKNAYKYSVIHTIEDADKYWDVDSKSIDLLIARVIKVRLTEYKKESIQSFFYNCGYSETLVRLINTKDKTLSEWWESHYITGQGSSKPLPGLIARRKTEALLFTTGELKFFN